MDKTIEIDGVRYTEFQLRRALALEKAVLSPDFIPDLIERSKSLAKSHEKSSKGGI